MRKLSYRPGLVFLGSVLLSALQSCVIPPPTFERPVPVEISGDFRDAVFNPDTRTVSPGQWIRWSNRTEATITLQLEDAPVTPATIVVPPGGSGTVRVDDDARPGVYKYSALLRAGGEVRVIDPYIDVQPRR